MTNYCHCKNKPGTNVSEVCACKKIKREPLEVIQPQVTMNTYTPFGETEEELDDIMDAAAFLMEQAMTRRAAFYPKLTGPRNRLSPDTVQAVYKTWLMQELFQDNKEN